MKRKGMVAIWGKLCIKCVVMIKASDTYKRKTKNAEKKMVARKQMNEVNRFNIAFVPFEGIRIS